MSLHNYTKTASLQPGATRALEFQDGEARVVIVDARSTPKPAKYEKHALACLALCDEDGSGVETVWRGATVYLTTEELAGLCNLLPQEGRAVLHAWREKTPAVNRATGEVLLNKDGGERYNVKTLFKVAAKEGDEAADAWAMPEAVTPPPPVAAPSASATQSGPPRFRTPPRK